MVKSHAAYATWTRDEHVFVIWIPELGLQRVQKEDDLRFHLLL